MNTPITGIHHVTAMAKDPVKNHDFYTQILGLRMVKKTVNFDDPLTYHLYYGDHRGSPGTLLTHFPHPHAKPGIHGAPEIRETVLAIPTGTLDVWERHLSIAGVRSTQSSTHGETRLHFADHDDMRFAMVERQTDSPDDLTGRQDRPPAITGIDAVTVHVRDTEDAAGFLESVLGFERRDDIHGMARLTVADGRSGQRIELLQSPNDPNATMAAGVVHHVAWRVPNDEAQAEVARRVSQAGVAVTPVMDRQYFRSIYFRIPTGVIFEVATDQPGFTADEPLDTMGQALKLPAQFEHRRDEIESHLTPIN